MDAKCKSQWTVYIVATESGKLYTGITTDVARRLVEHRSGKRGAKFFRSTRIDRLVYKEATESRSQASRREAEIKKLAKRDKLRLIAGE